MGLNCQICRKIAVSSTMNKVCEVYVSIWKVCSTSRHCWCMFESMKTFTIDGSLTTNSWLENPPRIPGTPSFLVASKWGGCFLKWWVSPHPISHPKMIIFSRKTHGCLLSHMGVSKNSGAPKWMVKIMENPINMGWFGGISPYFWKHPYLGMG